MKYRTLFTFLFIGLAVPGWAQQHRPSAEFENKLMSKEKTKAVIQVFAGPSISFLRGNIEVDNTNQNVRKAKYGYSLGLVFSREIKSKINLAVGIMYEKKGGISNATVTYFDELDQSFKQGLVEYDYEYDYLTVPIQPFYSIGSTERLSAGLGPYLSYLIKQTRARNPAFSSARELTDETDLNTKLDFGIIITIMFKAPINSRSLMSFQITNTLGLLNIRPNLYQGQVMKTNNTSLLIGLIPKKKKV